MIKRLRWKFVLINMTIVTLMLCVIFSLLYSFTWVDLENKSIAMMRSIADNPAGQGRAVPPSRPTRCVCPISPCSWGRTGRSSPPGAATMTCPTSSFCSR